MAKSDKPDAKAATGIGAFRLLLVALWLALATYTGLVIADHGWGLFPIFFGDIARLVWPGQFNLDFMCFLTLSALWTAWRGHFAPSSIALAAVAFVGGAGFLLPYLLWLSFKTGGDVQRMLFGERRISAS